MVQLSIEAGKLVCEVEGLHKFWAMRSRLAIPLEHIKGAEARSEDTRRWWHGWKMMGSDIPGVFAAGTFRLKGKWVFWDVSDPERAVEIFLKDEDYASLLVEVEDPEGAVEMIRRAVGG